MDLLNLLWIILAIAVVIPLIHQKVIESLKCHPDLQLRPLIRSEKGSAINGRAPFRTLSQS